MTGETRRVPFCSDSARERADPLTGTAGLGRRWFLIEVDGGWGRHALFESRFPREVAVRLVPRLERGGVRPLAIRRPSRRADERRRTTGWRWAAIDARPGRERLRWGRVQAAEELIEAAFDDHAGEASDEPVYCVCTHARHDRCCAVKGRPVVAAVAAAHPEATWECSHLGGDRFAPTMVLFPHALHYGALTPQSALRAIELHAAGRVLPEVLRGRSSLPMIEQAAHQLARARLGDDSIDAVRTLSVTGDPAGGWEVELDHRGEQVRVRLEERLSEPILTTCSAASPVRVRQFVPG